MPDVVSSVSLSLSLARSSAAALGPAYRLGSAGARLPADELAPIDHSAQLLSLFSDSRISAETADG